MLQAAGGTQTDTPLFTELIALRLMINAMLRHIATEEHLMTKQIFAQVLAEVKATKHEAAREVLT